MKDSGIYHSQNVHRFFNIGDCGKDEHIFEWIRGSIYQFEYKILYYYYPKNCCLMENHDLGVLCELQKKLTKISFLPDSHTVSSVPVVWVTVVPLYYSISIAPFKAIVTASTSSHTYSLQTTCHQSFPSSFLVRDSLPDIISSICAFVFCHSRYVSAYSQWAHPLFKLLRI